MDLLGELKNKYEACTKCCNCQHQVKVFGAGNPSAKIVIVGEGPGQEEVAKLTPFIGPAGQLLELILSKVGLKREDLYFTNTILCRTGSNNRTPTKAEYTNCKTRLFEELSILKPRYVLMTGSTALKTIFGDQYKIMDCHGKWFTHLSYPCFFYYSILHPAWILHSTSDTESKAKKQTMWNDVRKWMKELKAFDEINWENK